MTGIDSPSGPVSAASPSLKKSLSEAALVVVLCSVAAICFNAVRPNSLPLVARMPYQTLVPCPEPGGPVAAVEADDPVIAGGGTFIVDARPEAAYAHRHLPGAVNLPYDWLDPVPDDRLQELAVAIAASRATRVVVYGDGGRPDSGEHLGREISGRGIKNVFFVAGGAPTLLGEEEQ